MTARQASVAPAKRAPDGIAQSRMCSGCSEWWSQYDARRPSSTARRQSSEAPRFEQIGCHDVAADAAAL